MFKSWSKRISTNKIDSFLYSCHDCFKCLCENRFNERSFKTFQITFSDKIFVTFWLRGTWLLIRNNFIIKTDLKTNLRTMVFMSYPSYLYCQHLYNTLLRLTQIFQIPFLDALNKSSFAPKSLKMNFCL